MCGKTIRRGQWHPLETGLPAGGWERGCPKPPPLRVQQVGLLRAYSALALAAAAVPWAQEAARGAPQARRRPRETPPETTTKSSEPHNEARTRAQWALQVNRRWCGAARRTLGPKASVVRADGRWLVGNGPRGAPTKWSLAKITACGMRTPPVPIPSATGV